MIRVYSKADNVFGSPKLNIAERKLFIKRSAIDHQLPDMYNFEGEQLFYVEVPIEALGNVAISEWMDGTRALFKRNKSISKCDFIRRK